jgi:hypothetical protein
MKKKLEERVDRFWMFLERVFKSVMDKEYCGEELFLFSMPFTIITILNQDRELKDLILKNWEPLNQIDFKNTPNCPTFDKEALSKYGNVFLQLLLGEHLKEILISEAKKIDRQESQGFLKNEIINQTEKISDVKKFIKPIQWQGTKEQFTAMINVLTEAKLVSDEKKYEQFKKHFSPLDGSEWGDLSGKAVKLYQSEKDGKPRKKVAALTTALKTKISGKSAL